MSEEKLPKTTFKSFQEFFDTPPEDMMYQEQRDKIIKQSVEIADQKQEIEEQAPDHKKMRAFTYHHVLKTQDSHPNIKKKFVKKFGAHNVKHFDKHVSNIVDQYDPKGHE